MHVRQRPEPLKIPARAELTRSQELETPPAPRPVLARRGSAPARLFHADRTPKTIAPKAEPSAPESLLSVRQSQAARGPERIAPRGLADADWGSSTAVKKSSEGVNGVYFVKMPDQDVVVKPLDEAGTEVLGALLAQRLGFAGPAMHVVPSGSEKGKEVTDNIGRLAASSPDERTQEHGGKLAAFGREHGAPTLLTMSRLSATNLFEATKGKMEELFGKGGEEGLSGAGKAMFRDLGRLTAFDQVIGNGDRLPNNPGNIMFDSRTGGIVVIDSATSTPDPRDVDKLITALLENKLDVGPGKIVRQGVNLFRQCDCEFDPGPEAQPILRRGMLEGFLDLAKTFAPGDLAKAAGELTKLDPHMKGLEHVKVDDLEAAMAVVRRRAPEIARALEG